MTPDSHSSDDGIAEVDSYASSAEDSGTVGTVGKSGIDNEELGITSGALRGRFGSSLNRFCAEMLKESRRLGCSAKEDVPSSLSNRDVQRVLQKKGQQAPVRNQGFNRLVNVVEYNTVTSRSPSTGSSMDFDESQLMEPVHPPAIRLLGTVVGGEESASWTEIN